MTKPLTLEELRKLSEDLALVGDDWGGIVFYYRISADQTKKLVRAVRELIAIRERPVDAIADAATIKTNRVKTGP